VTELESVKEYLRLQDIAINSGIAVRAGWCGFVVEIGNTDSEAMDTLAEVSVFMKGYECAISKRV
jgi:hypothetical protein